jgi:hypothetical protein
MLWYVLSILPQIYFHVVFVSSWITEFENIYAETFAVLWYVMFQNHPPLEGNNNFVNGEIFRRVV